MISIIIGMVLVVVAFAIKDIKLGFPVLEWREFNRVYNQNR